MLGTPHLRAGDADRERMAAELSRHCAEGRLSADELSERLEVAYRARTLGELGAVASDLPARPTRPAPRRGARAALLLAAALFLGLAAIGFVGAAVQAPEAALVGLIVVALVGVVLVALLVPVLVTAAPFVAVAAAAVWAARRWAALERPPGPVGEGR